ncbi:MAG TPA: DUF4388 domain-containing protein [Candidatus Polarisedimenticolia bacterium]|jgi:hypothetical protein|nr:DUF4388 domain-containing protein [Candidatus Polarisedimenticolia bacterium]
MPEASRAAPLAGVFPPRLVARLHREQFEGTLRVQAKGLTRVLYFRRGDIASAASNANDDRLHNILIRDGRLTGPQVDMARARQRPGVSLGKTLIELGFLTPAELLQGARRQVRQILAAVFALADGSFEIVSGPLPPEVTVLGLPAKRLIFDALLQTGDRQTVVREMGSMESVYRTTDLFRDSLPALRLEAAHAEVAAQVDGTATLRDLSGRTRLDDLTVSKIVLALEILGLVEPAAAEVPRPASAMSRRILVESTADAAPADAVAIRLAFDASAPTVPPEAPEPVIAPPPATVSPEPVAAPPATPVFSEPTSAEPAPSPPAPARDENADGAAAEDDYDEEPPPPGDLPAFAAPYAAPVGWQIDPETGERSHPGPVEMTFDGSVIPPPTRPKTGGRTFAAAGVLLVIAIGAYAAVRLNRKPAADHTFGVETRTAEIAPPSSPAPGQAAARPANPEAAEPPAVQPPMVQPPMAQPPMAQASAKEAPAAEAPAPPLTEPPARHPNPAPEPEAAVPPPAPTAPRTPTTPKDEPQAPASGAGPDLTPGERLLDAGAVDRASDAFGRTLTALPAETLTLQMMIACESETVRKARLGTRPASRLFVAPITVRNRSCYRVLWGLYATRAEAEAAQAAPPPYFSAAGVRPAIVSIGRIRRPA